MKSGVDIMNKDAGIIISKSLSRQSNVLFNVTKRTNPNFNAAVGIFVMSLAVVIFFLISITALVSFGLNIDFLPIVVAMMLAATVVVTLFVLSHGMNVFNVLINK